MHFFFVADPDGYQIEVLQRHGRYRWRPCGGSLMKGRKMMNRINRTGMTRRDCLKRSVAAGGTLLIGAHWVTGQSAAREFEVSALKP